MFYILFCHEAGYNVTRLHVIADPSEMQQSSCYLTQREATFDNWGLNVILECIDKNVCYYYVLKSFKQ